MNKKILKIINFIIIVLILSDIILLTTMVFIKVSPQMYLAIEIFDLIVVLVLIPEFCIRLWKSEDKKNFLKHNWTDIIGMIPEILVGPISSIFRYFRLIRVVRIIALFKKDIRHIFEFLHKSKIDYGITVVSIVLISGAIVFFIFETGTNPNIKGFDDAIWYLVVTITTVGYGDIYPQTDAGRLVAAAIMFTGIGFMSFLTAIVATTFIQHNEKKEKEDIKEIKENLESLKLDMAELKDLIKK